MKVEVRLYATFAQHALIQRAGDSFGVELGDSASLTDLIRKLRIPEDDVHLAIVNGRIIHKRTQALVDAGHIALFPPIGGGWPGVKGYHELYAMIPQGAA